MSDALDIKELEHLLDEAGSFDELSDKAIEIAKRIIDRVEQLDRTRHAQDDLDALERKADDFDRVMEEIDTRRGKGALERYREWERSITGPDKNPAVTPEVDLYSCGG